MGLLIQDLGGRVPRSRGRCQRGGGEEADEDEAVEQGECGGEHCRLQQ